MKVRTLLCVVSFVLSTGLAAAPSKTTGTLSGTVTDPTDSIVPGAKVTATNSATGTVLDTVSDDRGEYRIPLMPPGAYDLKVDKPGFAAAAPPSPRYPPRARWCPDGSRSPSPRRRSGKERRSRVPQ